MADALKDFWYGVLWMYKFPWKIMKHDNISVQRLVVLVVASLNIYCFSRAYFMNNLLISSSCSQEFNVTGDTLTQSYL